MTRPARIRRGLLFCVVFLAFFAGAAGGAAAQSLQKQGKNWKVLFNTRFIHDTNLTQASDVASLRVSTLPQLSDSGFNWNASGAYAYNHSDKFRVTFDYDIDMNTWSRLKQYNTLSQMFGVNPAYKVGDRMYASFQYFFIWNQAGGYDLDGDTFSTVHYFSPSVTHLHPKWGMTRFAVRYSYSDNRVTDTRDTATAGFTLDHMYMVGKHSAVGLGYGFRSDNAQSSAFDRDIQDFKVKGRTRLPWQVDVAAEYKFSLRNYRNILSSATDFRTLSLATGDRQDGQHNVNLQFSRLLMEKWKFLEKLRARISFSRHMNDSNFSLRQYTSNLVQLGLEAVF